MASWASLGASTLIASAELDSLADDATVVGSAVAASQYLYADWFCRIDPGAAIPAGGILSLYFVTEMGGSAADGDASIDPANNLWVGNFVCRNTAGSQHMAINYTPLPNRDFTPIIINESGCAMGGSNQFIYFQPYNVDS